MPSAIDISIIIPTVNEAELLPGTLESIGSTGEAGVEVLVVDAESEDETAKIADRCGTHLITSNIRQRAHQMNLGAREAAGPLLLFLHADSRLPPGGLDALRHAMEDTGTVGGAFIRRFEHPSAFLRATCTLADLRCRFFGWHLGDQGIFARAGVFRALGGFPEWDLFEDLEFSRRLSRSGRTVTLRNTIRTSGRRFGKRPVARTVRDFKLTVGYLLNRPGNAERVASPSGRKEEKDPG